MHKKVALITGAASGIGKQFAHALIKKGSYQVALTDINEEELKEHFQPQDDVVLYKLDVRDVERWREVIADVLARYNGLDYLFNIAGLVAPGFLLNTSTDDVDRIIDINTKGVIHGTRFGAEVMVKQGHGHIINVASLAGVTPVPGLSLYTASKFAVRGFSLAEALTLREKGVAVTVICPDLVDTPMLDLQLDYLEESALVFSGPKPLTVVDLEKAFFKAMQKKPLEMTLPPLRGVLSKIGSAFPSLLVLLAKPLSLKGQRSIKKFRQQRPDKWGKTGSSS
ncbi:SDR family oxidoreductase [candidate division CSSED10-310 bacterium]|uniref:SDR family oxidoreductase n=1 Tax=candidate division CSSED10-310 bacterium TaxID=2855610 RepID=A0ABV6YWJ5_UNCC1